MTPRAPLTGRQRLVYEYIRDFIETHGVAPTYDEMGKHFGRTLGTLHGLVDQLVDKGWIVRGEHGTQRSLALAPDNGIAAALDGIAKRLRDLADTLPGRAGVTLRGEIEAIGKVAQRARAS